MRAFGLLFVLGPTPGWSAREYHWGEELGKVVRGLFDGQGKGGTSSRGAPCGTAQLTEPITDTEPTWKSWANQKNWSGLIPSPSLVSTAERRITEDLKMVLFQVRLTKRNLKSQAAAAQLFLDSWDWGIWVTSKKIPNRETNLKNLKNMLLHYPSETLPVGSFDPLWWLLLWQVFKKHSVHAAFFSYCSLYCHQVTSCRKLGGCRK